MNKVIKTLIFTLAICCIFSLKANAATNISDKTENGKNIITISSDEPLYSVKIYKKVGDKFILISKVTTDAKAASYIIPKDKLSTKGKTEFKVVVNQNEKVTTKDVACEKRTITPMNPAETAKPSTSSSAVPTKPTPSASTSASPSASNKPNSTTSDATENTQNQNDGDTQTQNSENTQTQNDSNTQTQNSNNTQNQNNENTQSNNVDPNKKNGFVKEDGKIYYYQNDEKVKGEKEIDGDKCFFNNDTGVLEGRIMGITYMNQSKGVYENGKYTHTNLPNVTTGSGKKFRSTACGIFSCSMAITAIRGELTLPTEFNNIKYGFNGNGSNYNVGVLTAKKYGLKGEVRTFSKKELINALMDGNFVTVWVHNSVYGAGGNLKGGDTGHGGHHFVLIHGYKNGKFAIADPNNISQSYLVSSNHKLNTWESFNSHLGNGTKGSYNIIYRKK